MDTFDSKRLIDIVNDIDDLIFEIDENGLILIANPAAQLFFKKNVKNTSPLNLYDFIASECHEEIKSLIKDSSGVARFEYKIKNSEGHETWMGTKITIKEQNGEKRITFISRDILERKTYEKKLKEVIDSLKILTHNLEVAVLYTDDNNEVIYANESFRQIFNLKQDPESLKGTCIDLSEKSFSKRVEDPIFFTSEVKSLKARREKSLGQRIKFKNEKTYEQDFIPVKERNKYLGNVWIFREITEKVCFEEKFKVIYEKSFIPIMLINKAGVIDANQAALKLLEAESISQIEGVHPSKFSPKRQPNRKFSNKEASKINKQIEAQGSCKFSWVHKSLNGKEFEVEASSSYLRIEGQRIEILMWQDVSKNKLQERRLIEKQNELEAFVGAAPAAIAMFDKKMNYIAASERWLDDYKLKGTEISGVNHYKLFTGIQNEWKHIHQRCMKGAIEKEEEDKAYHKDGTFDWIRWEVRPWFDYNYEIGGIIIMTEVITKQKEQEEELRLAKEKAEEASKAKALFLSAMSHEIRTPMNAVIGMSHLLLQSDPRPNQIEDLKTLQFAANNLLALINDILDFNKIEAGKIVFEDVEFNLRDQINGIIKSFSFKAKEKSLSLTCHVSDELPECYSGDPVRIGQILTNLISNAIKFTEEGCVGVEISMLAEYQEECNILFRVEDSGIGIEESKFDLIFDMFSQADKDTTRKFGGTGLGLAISKNLVELQGGEIKVDSEPGKGSTFSFNLSLPVCQPTKPTLEKKNSFKKDEQNLNGVKVLLVEDNPTNKLVAKKFLKMWNAEVSFAENGLEALEQIEKNDFDVVLMDLQMPIMDGYTATKKIRALKNHKSGIPIAALTASAMLEIKDKAFEVGMNEYISKPFIPGELLSKIQNLVSKTTITSTNESKLQAVNEVYDHSNEVSYNFEKIVKIANGDIEFTNDLIDSYSESLNEFISVIEKQINENDVEGVKKSTHKIKASLKFLEAKNIEDCISSLKRMVVAGDYDKSNMKLLLKEINYLTDKLLTDLERRKVDTKT
ncbi:MAG: ATP-binding protein [Bacteroidota bacterium]